MERSQTAEVTRGPNSPSVAIDTTATAVAGKRRWRLSDVMLPAALALWLVSLQRTDPSQMNDFGLIGVLPATFFAALVLLVSSTALLFTDDRIPTVRLALHLAMFVMILHGTVPALFEQPTYPWVYKHIGATEQINLYGTVDGTIDPYNNWPGFFAIAAFFTKISGASSPLVFAGWAPVFFNLLFCLELAFVFRALPVARKTRWLALFLFVGANWVGQDYFAPQAMAFVLSLAILGAALTWLQVARPTVMYRAIRWRAIRWPGRIVRKLRRGTVGQNDAVLPERRPLSLGAIGVVFGVYGVLVVSHQLSPFMVIFALGVLMAFGRAEPRWVVVAMAAMAGAFLLAHQFSLPGGNGLFYLDMRDLVAALGHPFGSDPLGGKPMRGRVITSLGAPVLIVLMWGSAAFGGLRRWWIGRPTLVLGLLAGAPALSLLLGGYGGEALFRVYLFSLPAVALLAACAIEPRHLRWGRFRAFQVWGLLIGVATLFMCAFFGSVVLYRARTSEVRAAQYFYEHAEPGSALINVAPQFPEKLSGSYGRFVVPSLDLLTTANEFRHRILGPRDLPAIDAFIEKYAWMRRRGAYITITDGQRLYADILGLAPKGAIDGLARALDASPAWERFYANDEATIYHQVDPPPRNVPAYRPAERVNARGIDWTEIVVAVGGIGLIATIRRRREDMNTTSEPARTELHVTDGAMLFDPSPPTREVVPLTEPGVLFEPTSARDAPTITDELNAIDRGDRPDAIRRIASERGPLGSVELRPLLSDPWAEVRVTALDVMDVGPRDQALLASMLRDDMSAQVRAAVVRAIARTDAASQLAAMAQAIADPSPIVREAAPTSLGVATTPLGAELLLTATEDEDLEVRRAAFRCLAVAPDWLLWTALGRSTQRAELCEVVEDAAPGRIANIAAERLSSPEAADRATAVELVGHLAVGRTVDLTRDTDASVRRAALARLHGRIEAVNTIVGALNDPDVDVRVEAVGALSGIDHDEAVRALVAKLQDPDLSVQAEARAVLARVSAPGLAGRVAAVLSGPNADATGALLLELGQRGEDALAECVLEGPPDRAAAAANLLRRGDRIAAIASKLGSTDPQVRLRAVEVLGVVGGDAALEGLMRSLTDPWEPVRIRAANHLGRLDDVRAREALRDALGTEPVAEVADGIRRALGITIEP